MDRHSSAPRHEIASDSLSPEGETAKGSVVLVHSVGMHARPAVKLTKLAKRFGAKIAVRVDGAADWIDAKSIAKVMAMRAARDSIIEFEASGPDAQAAVAALVTLVARDFPDMAR
jgi:phosphocarrier protein HPr